MFTGIVAETGIVQRIVAGPKSIRLAVSVGVTARGLKRGDSVAVNGCCLTAVGISRRRPRPVLQFDLLRETWDRTNFRELRVGSAVNLERPLRFGGTIDGHFVTGHIDGVGQVTRWEHVGADRVLEIAAAPELMRYIVYKGSIAIDGISLTVARLTSRAFRVWIIPHTYKVTALRERDVGDAVNLETDLLGKYVARFTTSRARAC